MEEKLLEEWQERLGLYDWLIILRYNCTFNDLELDNACRRNRLGRYNKVCYYKNN